jgi:AraC-like DNA-binding protein
MTWDIRLAAIKVANDRLNRTAAQPGQTPESRDPEIGTLLQQARNDGGWKKWEILFEAELRLVSLMPDAEVKAEAARRLTELAAFDAAAGAAMTSAFDKASNEAERLALLQRILHDVQTRTVRRRLDRETRGKLADKLNSNAVWLLLPVILLIALMTYQKSFVPAAHYHLLVLMWFGMLGAFLSRMITFQRVAATVTYDSLVVGFSEWSVFMRLIIGAGAALVVSFMISGHLLGGETFPQKDFSKLIREVEVATGLKVLLPSVDFAKLIVWSTIAGFSERLLSDRFDDLESTSSTGKGAGGNG